MKKKFEQKKIALSFFNYRDHREKGMRGFVGPRCPTFEKIWSILLLLIEFGLDMAKDQLNYQGYSTSDPNSTELWGYIRNKHLLPVDTGELKYNHKLWEGKEMLSSFEVVLSFLGLIEEYEKRKEANDSSATYKRIEAYLNVLQVLNHNNQTGNLKAPKYWSIVWLLRELYKLHDLAEEEAKRLKEEEKEVQDGLLDAVTPAKFNPEWSLRYDPVRVIDQVLALIESYLKATTNPDPKRSSEEFPGWIKELRKTELNFRRVPFTLADFAEKMWMSGVEEEKIEARMNWWSVGAEEIFRAYVDTHRQFKNMMEEEGIDQECSALADLLKTAFPFSGKGWVMKQFSFGPNREYRGIAINHNNPLMASVAFSYKYDLVAIRQQYLVSEESGNIMQGHQATQGVKGIGVEERSSEIKLIEGKFSILLRKSERDNIDLSPLWHHLNERSRKEQLKKGVPEEAIKEPVFFDQTGAVHYGSLMWDSPIEIEISFDQVLSMLPQYVECKSQPERLKFKFQQKDLEQIRKNGWKLASKEEDFDEAEV